MSVYQNNYPTLANNDGQRWLDTDPITGRRWMLAQPMLVGGVTETFGWYLWYSDDNGASWTKNPNAFIPIASTNSLTDDERGATIRFDKDGHLHVLYDDGGMTYRRMASPGTTTTWSDAVRVSTAPVGTSYEGNPALAVHREGTGWVAHCVWGYQSAQQGVYHRPITISSGGIITAGTETRVRYVSADTRRPFVAVEFRHDGDGLTVDGNPDLYVVYGVSTNLASLEGKIGTYSNGSWSWSDKYSKEAAVDTSDYKSAMSAVWDGSVMHVVYAENNYAVVRHVTWDPVTGTVTQQPDPPPLNRGRVYSLSLGMGDGGSLVMVAQAYDDLTNGPSVIRRDGSAWGAWQTLRAVAQPRTSMALSVERVARGGYLLSLGKFNSTNPYDVEVDIAATFNTAPNAPTLTSMHDGAAVDRAIVNRATHNFSDPDPGDTQSKADYEHRLVGDTSWTVVTVTNPNEFYDYPAGYFAAGNYERRVRTYDAQGVAGPYSSIGYFTAADAPESPTITDPVNNGNISTQSYEVVWSTPNQTHYEIQLLDAADAIVYGSGEVQNSTTRSRVIEFVDNNVTRKIRVRIKNNGLWSAWTTITVTVSFTAPAAFTIAVTAVDRSGIGTPHVLSVDSTHPAPTGSQPTVSYEEIYVREVGDTGDGIRICSNCPPSQAFSYLSPAATVAYEFRTKAIGDNGTSTWSAWTAAPIITFDGVLIHDPLDHDGSLLHIVHNSQGASDSFEVEHATLAYQGREFPVVEFGDASEHTVEVGLIQSLSGESAALRELVKRRTILCYRDGVGRKVYGVVGINVIADAFYGSDTSVSFTEVDYSEVV